MNDRLNKKYFETKNRYKRSCQTKKKLTRKRAVLNLLITILLIFIYTILNKGCEARIKQNTLNDIEKNEN